jgi:hypothetical protein
MEYGGDLDDIIAQAVDDSIVAVDDLTDRLVAELGYDTSRARVILEPFNSRDEPFNDEIGIVSRVAGDMRAYRLDVMDCLRCPDDLGHRSSRRFASA